MATTGTATPAPVQAARAADFVGSIGIDTHVSYYDTTYDNFSLIQSALAYLGVGHIRDFIPSIYDTGAQARLTTLASEGMKLDLIVPTATPDAAALAIDMGIVDAIAAAGSGSIAAIEGPNEIFNWPVVYDGVGGTAGALALQEALYHAVHSDAALQGTEVYDLTGAVSAASDAANAHVYYFSNTPSTLLATDLQPVELAGQPTVITETGSYTLPTYGGGLNQDVQAKYMLDMVLDAFHAGVQTTYVYELLDEAADPSGANPELHYGLFNTDGTPKESAVALHDLTAILADPQAGGGSFAPGSLSFSLSGMPATASDFLLEKHSGAFDIVLWNETAIWSEGAHAELSASASNVVVQLDHAYSTVELFDPIQGSAPVASFTNASSVTLSLADDPLILEIEPEKPPSSASGAIAPPPPPTQVWNAAPADGNGSAPSPTHDPGTGAAAAGPANAFAADARDIAPPYAPPPPPALHLVHDEPLALEHIVPQAPPQHVDYWHWH